MSENNKNENTPDLELKDQADNSNDQGLETQEVVEVAENTTEVVSEQLDSNGFPIPQKINDPTLKESARRLGGNGKLRFIGFAVIALILIIIFAAKYLIAAFTKPPIPDAESTITVPRTNAAASAISSPEQAEYLKNKQDEAGKIAEQKGETYLPEFITTRDEIPEELAPATQPGVSVSAIKAKEFKDLAGNVYTAEKAAELAAQGVELEGVTVGKGSISDPNLGAISNQPNAPQAETKVEILPYAVTPLVTSNSSPNAAKSEINSNEIAALEKTTAEAEQWSQDYFNVRLKKARLVDAKVQLSLEKQIEAISSRIKETEVDSKVKGFSSVQFALPPVPKDEPLSVQEEKSQNNNNYFKPVIFAGESYRAILRNEVNTDNGTEVIASLQNGPLKGSTIMGTVTITKGNINFNFNRLLRKNKSEINITAIGRQLGTNSAGMADEINKHYIKRYTALVVAQTLKGVGEAYEQTSGVSASAAGNSVIVEGSDPSTSRIKGAIAGEIGNELSGEIRDVQRTPTTYKTNSGKVFNVFFNQDVRDVPEGTNK